MMMKTNPITPPPEVVDRLFMIEGSEEDRIIAAYRAGADQELEACCRWLAVESIEASQDLRAARRPKPPSLKEQALELVRRIEGTGSSWALSELGVVRRALEALDD
jgi:hypothetical protein